MSLKLYIITRKQGCFEHPFFPTSEFSESEICHLQDPPGVDKAITGAQIAVVENVAFVKEDHALRRHKHVFQNRGCCMHAWDCKNMLLYIFCIFLSAQAMWVGID
jgi:hypothetical protein